MANPILTFFETPERDLFGDTLGDWIMAVAIVAAVWASLWFLRHLIARRYQNQPLSGRRVTAWFVAQLVVATQHFFMLAIAVYVGAHNLKLPHLERRDLTRVIPVLLALQVGIWAIRAVRLYLEIRQQAPSADRALTGSMQVILFVARVVIWSVLLLATLENLGVNITALLAGLGVGGVAVALALQNILGDLFASLSIALDKPFVAGDTLTIDTYTGTVEQIGIKTTRLRSETGEQIILSNADILKSRVRNYGRATELRVLATIRVPYTTPTDKLLAIPAMLTQIVGRQEHARFERCHLKTLGEWALQFELSYFGLDPDQHSVLDLQHAVNCLIVAGFHEAGIDFALPTQRVLSTG